MLPTRTVGKLVRTKASRSEVTGAWLIGSFLGFLPGFVLPGDLGGGFALAPGLILLGLFAAAVFRVESGMLALAMLLAKVVSVPLLPVSEALGRLLVDGMEPVFLALRDTPVIAWFGPEHYATVGGALLGTAFGIGTGAAAWRLLQGFRGAMARLDERDGFAKVAGNRWVKMLRFAAVGGDKGKQSWQELRDAEQRFLPGVRWQGAVIAVLAGVAFAVVQSQLAGRQMRESVVAALQDANGATVDLATADVNLLRGQVRLEQLAMADPAKLSTDVFRAELLELNLDMQALAERRMVVAQLTAVGASFGIERQVSGKIIVPTRPEREVPAGDEPGDGSLEDWIATADRWHERLQQTARWIERIGIGGNGDGTNGEHEEGGDSAFFGMAKSYNRAIGDRHPAALLRSVRIDKIESDWLEPGDHFTLRASNLSTHPDRVDQPIELELVAVSGRFRVAMRREPGDARSLITEVVFDGLPVDATLASLGVEDSLARGGVARVRLAAELDLSGEEPRLEAPLELGFEGAELVVGGFEPMKLDGLPVSFALRGPLAQPSVGFDSAALQKALVQRGREELVTALQQQARGLLDEHLMGLPAPLAESVDRALEGDLDGALEHAEAEARAQAEQALREAEERARQAAEEAREKAEREARERLQREAARGLRGLFGGRGRR